MENDCHNMPYDVCAIIVFQYSPLGVVGCVLYNIHIAWWPGGGGGVKIFSNSLTVPKTYLEEESCIGLVKPFQNE